VLEHAALSACSLVKAGEYVYYADVDFLNGRFFASGSGGAILTSSDGSAWVRHKTGTTNALTKVAFGADRYIAVGDAGTILISTNGVDWRLLPPVSPSLLTGLAFGKGLFVASGFDGTVLTSPDGALWTVAYSNACRRFNDVVFANDKFILAGSVATTFIDVPPCAVRPRAPIMTSSNGYDWTETAVTYEISLNAVVFGAGRYLAVGGYGLTSSVSDNGFWWTTYGSAPVARIFDVCFGKNSFVAVGPLGATLVTEDGAVWKNPQAVTVRGLNGVAFGVDRFVAVGDNGTILQSTLDPPPRPVLEAKSFDTEDRFQFEIWSAPGVSLIIQASSNLVDWVELKGQQGPGTSKSVVDPQSPGLRARFYRTIQP